MSEGKCVYITGGSSGIGLAMAEIYVSSGADVILIARDKVKLEAAVTTCKNGALRAGQRVAAESCDITNYQELSGKLDDMVERHGLPDLVILSAGVAGNRTFLDTSAEEFDSVINVNLSGSSEVARILLPAMLQRGSGQMVFISSMAGLVGLYGYSAYAASKFAVTGMVQALRQELAGSGVSAQLVCPPEVATPMIAAEAQSGLPQTRFLKDLVGTLAPAVAAKKIVAGVERRQAVIVPGVRAKLVVFVAQHFPDLFSRSSSLLLRWKFR